MNSTPPKHRNVKQKLAQVQMKVLVVGTFPTSGANGQFSVHDQLTSGRRATQVRAE